MLIEKIPRYGVILIGTIAILFSSNADVAAGYPPAITQDTPVPTVPAGKPIRVFQVAEPKPGSSLVDGESYSGFLPPESFIGPDAFGYTLTDSNELLGPDFQWQDISLDGTDLNLTDDSYAYPIQLPFSFEFYGQSYDSLAVGSNGVIYFEDVYLGFENTTIATTNSYGVEAYIAVYWDDLDPGSGGAVYYRIDGNAPDRRLIVQWEQVPLYGPSGASLTAQAILYEATNNILVQYQHPSGEAGAHATEGIQGDVSTGLLYGYDQPVLDADLALCFAPPGNATDCSGVGLVLEKTAGLDPGTCSTRDLIIVSPDTEVAYCYRATNISGITFTRHDLEDTELGTLASSLPLSLNPGEVTEQIRTGMISASTTNTGTWTAYNPGPEDVTTAEDTATVLVPVAHPLSCSGDPVSFEDGIPSDWLVVDDQGTGVVWTLSGESGYPYQCGEANYTDGGGYAACVSSEAFVAEQFDTSLISPVFALQNVSEVTLRYKANYQNFAGLDMLDLEISEDGGSSWTPLLSWNEDHGGDHMPPGEPVSIDLTGYIGETNLRLRWRYHISEEYAWYAQVDEISLDCSVPSILVTPGSLESELYPDETTVETLNVANEGSSDLHWTIVEQAAGATPCTPEDIAWLSVDPLSGTTPGSGDADVDVSLDSAGLAAGIYEAEICVSSDDPLQPSVVVPVTLTVDPLVDLSITKADDRDPAYVYTSMEYTLTVTNLGPSEATGLALEDHLPPEAVFVETLPGPWSCSEDLGVVSCTLDTLPNGNQAVLEYNIQLPGKEGSVANMATVSAAEFDPDLNNNTVSEETLLVYRKIFLPLIQR